VGTNKQAAAETLQPDSIALQETVPAELQGEEDSFGTASGQGTKTIAKAHAKAKAQGKAQGKVQAQAKASAKAKAQAKCTEHAPAQAKAQAKAKAKLQAQAKSMVKVSERAPSLKVSMAALKRQNLGDGAEACQNYPSVFLRATERT
jgi:colicin import membrane protein